MEMIKVPSVMIRAVGHEGETLYVEFVGGVTYKYWPVSNVEYKELISADSVGRYFSGNIKKTKQYAKVEDDE